jgi:hypothetical protein
MAIPSIFISSVQRELAEERRALKAFIEGDALLRRFFAAFIFEDLPARDRRADQVYLSQSGGQFVQTVSRVRSASATEVATEVTTEVTTEVALELRLLHALTGEMTRQQLQAALQLKNDEHFRKAYLQPALQAGLIERTVPDKPQSRLQKYRRTTKGVEELARRATGADSSAGQDRDRDHGQK